MLKIWDLAKKSHFASVLATDAVYANFLHTMMNYIENGIRDQFLEKNVGEILTWQRQPLLSRSHITFLSYSADASLHVGRKLWWKYVKLQYEQNTFICTRHKPTYSGWEAILYKMTKFVISIIG